MLGPQAGPSKAPLYFLTLHEPYEDVRDPQPVNATLVDARTLLHPALPQPDGALIYRCVTEAPGRAAGSVVPLSTVTFELDGGELWPWVGDWEAVSEALAVLARRGGCDALRLGVPHRETLLVAHGLTTRHPTTEGGWIGGAQRQEVLDHFASAVARFAAEGALWTGDGLVPVPSTPERMLYRPTGPRTPLLGRPGASAPRAVRSTTSSVRGSWCHPVDLCSHEHAA